MERRKLNNRGFSLIELIVVIAILVVLAGAAVSLVGLLNGRQAKQGREKLFTRLDGVRTTTMGKRTATATLEKRDSNYILVVTSTVNGSDSRTNEYIIADSEKVTLYYSKNKDGSEKGDWVEIGSGSPPVSVTIEFDRASGALKAQGDGTYIYHIYAVQGSKEYGIRLYPETGKIQKEN